jgi:nucleotide-binding universal stress UspA family protein
MAHVSHRLKGALEGALAGGGDPASSPLYVFGPFLRLLAASGAGAVCFGAPLWMVVATVIVVSLMYRHVMRWIPDGSGGSGLCEEEFGGWAVKINASITAIEYTLTFLVSLAALVTFVADRTGGLGRWPRTALAVGLTVGVGAVVNRGPRLAAKVFGPATAAVLALLWVLVIAVIVQRGIHLPSVSFEAFSSTHLHTTLGGYVRLLALMTGIEVFANLVAAYDGPPSARARKAFGSLLIVMVTTLVTMLVVGPAIQSLADPARQDVSVFTQTMDRLLPSPVAYLGTLVGVVVLLSAAAASAQGLQNLSLGLRHRHYVPAIFGQRNRFDVADRPVVAQVLLVAGCFVAFGTHEDTYLTLYAAGVFVLLGLTGWAAVKRFSREWRAGRAGAVTVAGTVVAALVTSGAAALIFFERFTDGAWAYVVMVPGLYFVFSRYRARLGAPTPVGERLGRALLERKSFVPVSAPTWPQGVLAVIDGSQRGEVALVAGAHVADVFGVPLSACLVGDLLALAARAYVKMLAQVFRLPHDFTIEPAGANIVDTAHRLGADLIVVARELEGARTLARTGDCAVLVVQAASDQATRYPTLSRVLVGLDGSSDAEAVLPCAARLLSTGATVVIVAVPDGDTSEEALRAYSERVAGGLRQHGNVEVVVDGSGPARTLVEKAKDDGVDLVVIASHGRGGAQRAANVPLGSVPERLLSDLDCPVLIIPSSTAVRPETRQEAVA